MSQNNSQDEIIEDFSGMTQVNGVKIPEQQNMSEQMAIQQEQMQPQNQIPQEQHQIPQEMLQEQMQMPPQQIQMQPQQMQMPPQQMQMQQQMQQQPRGMFGNKMADPNGMLLREEPTLFSKFNIMIAIVLLLLIGGGYWWYSRPKVLPNVLE